MPLMSNEKINETSALVKFNNNQKTLATEVVLGRSHLQYFVG